jgi:hypothetical protein
MDAGPQKDGWRKEITAGQSERLKYNNSGAEHFIYDDESPWLHPTSQAYWDRVAPDHLNEGGSQKGREAEGLAFQS